MGGLSVIQWVSRASRSKSSLNAEVSADFGSVCIAKPDLCLTVGSDANSRCISSASRSSIADLITASFGDFEKPNPKWRDIVLGKVAHINEK